MSLFTHYLASILLSPSPFFTLAKQISLSQFSDYSPYAKKTSSSSLAWLTTPSLIYTPLTSQPHLLPLLPPPWVWQVKETAPHSGHVTPRHTPFTSTFRPPAGALSLQSFSWLGQQLLNTEPQLRKKKCVWEALLLHLTVSQVCWTAYNMNFIIWMNWTSSQVRSKESDWIGQGYIG